MNAEIRQSAQNALRQAWTLARELRRRDALVYCVLEGPLSGGGGPFRLHYLGRERFVNDFTVYFERQGETPAVNRTFTINGNYVSFMRTRSRLQTCPNDADLLVVDRFLSSAQADDRFTLMAPFLNAYLPIEADITAQLSKVRSKGHRRKLQSALKRNVTWRQSRDVADFNLWYDTMYADFVVNRFGGDASIVKKEDMQEVFTKRGFLLLLEEDSQPVSGAFMYTSRNMPGTLAYWKYALRDATTLPPNAFGERNAKTEAMVLSFAVQEKYQEIDFGLTRALPKDGIFTHKKRLGCDFRAPDHTPKFALLFADAARVRFLQAHPLVVMEQGSMHAWAAQLGELSPPSMENLKDTLNACSFASLQSIQLFTQDIANSRNLLLDTTTHAGVELNCRVDLVEPTL